MRVRLTRKLAGHINGIDLRAHQPGDVFDISVEEGRLLIAEGWAIAERRFGDRGERGRQFGSAASPTDPVRMAHAADRPRRRASDAAGDPPANNASDTPDVADVTKAKP